MKKLFCILAAGLLLSSCNVDEERELRSNERFVVKNAPGYLRIVIDKRTGKEYLYLTTGGFVDLGTRDELYQPK